MFKKILLAGFIGLSSIGVSSAATQTKPVSPPIVDTKPKCEVFDATVAQFLRSKGFYIRFWFIDATTGNGEMFWFDETTKKVVQIEQTFDFSKTPAPITSSCLKGPGIIPDAFLKTMDKDRDANIPQQPEENKDNQE